MPNQTEAATWTSQELRSAIPRSTKPARIAENFDVFDFRLTAEQLAAIDGLDTGRHHPGNFGRPIPEA